MHYINYKKEEDLGKALIGFIHKEEVARVVATEERNFNVSKSVTLEHCFKEERKQELQKRGKHQDGFSVPSRIEKGITCKIYLKQQLIKDSFEVKRYSKGLLVQIKEICKI